MGTTRKPSNRIIWCQSSCSLHSILTIEHEQKGIGKLKMSTFDLFLNENHICNSQGMSWPPRSSRGQQGGQGQGGTNSLPLGAINDPMDMGQMRNSLNNIGKNSSATFGNMSQVKYQFYNSVKILF